MQDIITVGRDNEVVYRQAHAVGKIARVYVSKVARWHRKIHGLIGSPQGKRCIEVINDLSHDSCPVDRVDCNQRAALRQEGVGNEARFYQSLTIIKIAANCEVMDVISRHGGHLSPLHVGYTAIRVQDENIHVLAVATTLDCRATRISRRRTHDDHFLATAGEHVIEQPPE